MGEGEEEGGGEKGAQAPEEGQCRRSNRSGEQQHVKDLIDQVIINMSKI